MVFRVEQGLSVLQLLEDKKQWAEKYDSLQKQLITVTQTSRDKIKSMEDRLFTLLVNHFIRRDTKRFIYTIQLYLMHYRCI